MSGVASKATYVEPFTDPIVVQEHFDAAGNLKTTPGAGGAPTAVRVQDGTGAPLATVRTPADAAALVSALVVEADLSARNAAGTLDQLRTAAGAATGKGLAVSIQDANSALIALLNNSFTDTQSGGSLTALEVQAFAMLYDNPSTNNWLRFRAATVTNLGAFSGLGAALVSEPGEWGIFHTPAVATIATISKAAVAATRHVAKAITVGIVAGAAAQLVITFVLRDGASGAGTILWTCSLSCVLGDSKQVVVPVHLVGSVNTAMTLETLLAPNATAFATVSLTGYDAV